MADIQYLNYGDLQIELLALLNNLANNVLKYVNSQSWSTKRKEKFMSAYSDLMRGLQGASNVSGQWFINVDGDDIPFDTMSKKDKEMYLEAAYFIQQQMAALPTKAKEEEKKKEDLPVFDNKYFTSGLQSHIGTKMFGGRDWTTSEDWNVLDERNDKGIRGRKNRANTLAKYLRSYADSLDESKLNFEGSPFTDLNDFKNRINKAIEALGTESTEDDIPALNAIGLRASDWFNNGSGDPVTLEDGTTTTYGQLAEYNKKVKEAKLKLAEADRVSKLKAIRANQYDNYRFLNLLNGTPGTQEDFNLINLKLAGQQTLDGNDLSKISWAFRQGIKNGGLSNLSKEELAKFNSRYTAPNRLKKLTGLEGIYYDSVANRLIQPFKGLQLTGATLSGILAENSPEALAKKKLEDKLKAANRELSKGWEAEDYLRMGAMALDIVGGLAAWAPGYGTATSGILGLTSLGTNMAADIADESMSKWDVAKNGLVNAGLAVVGMVPGLGLASKTGKWLTTIARWAPRLLTIQALKDTPEVYASIKKAVDNPSKVTNLDWKNIAYGLSIAAGLSRGASGFAKNRIYKPAFTENTEKQYTITTSKGKKTITLKLVDEIKKLNPKDKENYNQELKKTLGLAEDETVNMKDVSILGKTIKEKGIDIKEENVPVGLSAKAKAYKEYLENRNNAMKNGEGIYKYAPRFLPTNYDIYKGAATAQIPSFGLSDKLRNLWNPLSDKNLLRKGIKIEESRQQNSPKQLKNLLTLALPNKNPLVKNSPLDRTPIDVKSHLNIKQEIEVPKNYKSVDLKSREIIESFQHSYGLGGLKSTSMLNGFGGNAVKAGKYESDLLNITLSRNKAKELRTNPGKLAEFRGENDRKVQSLITSKKATDKEIVEVIKALKKKGFLKQGGTIDKQKIQKYKEFIKK